MMTITNKFLGAHGIPRRFVTNQFYGTKTYEYEITVDGVKYRMFEGTGSRKKYYLRPADGSEALVLDFTQRGFVRRLKEYFKLAGLEDKR